MINECLGKAMIKIAYKTVLSLTDLFKSSLGRLSAFGLKLSTEFLIFAPGAQYFLSAAKQSLALFVIAGSQKAQTAVNPNDVLGVL